EIHGATDVTIKVSDLFDAMQGITVTDKEDDATATLVKLEVTGDVDTTKAGKYVVTYTATDSVGNVTTVERIITVNGEMNGMNSIPTITLINPELTLKQDEGFDALEWATAADEEDGDLTAEIEVVKNTVNPAVSAMYEVTYKVTDSFGASTTATMSVYVDEKPEIHGATDLTIKVGETFDPMQGITVTDKEDDATGTAVKLVVTSDVDTTKAGKYVVTYTATDSRNNHSINNRMITIVATTPENPLLPETPGNGEGSTPPKPDEDRETTSKLPDTGALQAELFLALGGMIVLLSMIASKQRKNQNK
ncbi:MAG: immunoglobulin-like domain-containing protein, partial [Culicoidibacterales bacterium]